MPEDLRGKTALVTGASRGIGAATAIALARSGVSRLILHYGSYLEGAELTLSLVEGAGSQGELLPAELSTPRGIREFMADLQRADAEIDILVNNAGSLIERAKLEEFTEDLFDRVMNLNVKSPYFISRALLPGMRKRGGGVIVNVSSIAARTGGGPGGAIYAGAKAAVSAITKGMARELAPSGIRVNAVSPGTIDNHFHEQFSSRERLQELASRTPAGRLGTSEDVADTIVFLCSDASRYIYGQTIEVNGGMYML